MVILFVRIYLLSVCQFDFRHNIWRYHFIFSDLANDTTRSLWSICKLLRLRRWHSSLSSSISNKYRFELICYCRTPHTLYHHESKFVILHPFKFTSQLDHKVYFVRKRSWRKSIYQFLSWRSFDGSNIDFRLLSSNLLRIWRFSRDSIARLFRWPDHWWHTRKSFHHYHQIAISRRRLLLSSSIWL